MVCCLLPVVCGCVSLCACLMLFVVIASIADVVEIVVVVILLLEVC